MAENEEPEAIVPDEIKDFVELLKDHEVKGSKAISIGKFISRTGSDEVFERPEELAGFLARYPRDLAPVQRRRILEQWFAEKGVPVPEELLTKTAMHPKEAEKIEKQEAKRKKAAEGEVWVVKIDDKGIPRITMATDDETGISLDEAKKAVTEIRKSYVGEEPLIVFDEKAQKHMPNFKSEFVKANPTIAWVAAKQMDKAMAEGTEIDPMDIFLEQLARTEQIKEAFGGKKEPETKGTIGELISGVKDLQSMAKEGKIELPNWMTDPAAFVETVQRVSGGETKGLPNWMTDPAAFIETVQRVTGGETKGLPNWMTDPVAFFDTMQKMSGGGAKGTPNWMTDPAEFIKTIRTISPEPKADEGLKEQITALTNTVNELKEERYREQITTQQQQIQALGSEIKDLKDYVVDMKRPVTGRTEMDIIHEVTTEGIGLAKSELAGLRRDLREAFGSTALPPPKTAEEREQRKGRYREAIETDKKIEEIGKRLFFGES